MSINLQLPKLTDLEPRLTVIGIGGAGCNAVNNMIAAGLKGVEFVVANTDAQALTASSAEHRIQLGVNLTEGLGAGARPEIGQAAAEEAIDDIRNQVSGSHMVFLAAGMGGGTGTGAATVIARVAREMGILVVGVVTKPFQFEGSRRMRLAEAGIEELKHCVDTLIVIPNQNLFRIANEKTTFAEAFVLADHVLYSGVACIVDLIIKEGLINLDFADVRTVMAGMGTAMMGTGEASGERRATVAAEEAISNPLLDDISLSGAKGLLLSITGGDDLTLFEVDEAASRVRSEVDGEATIIVGATFDETLIDKIRVSIVASGMDRKPNSSGFMNDGLSRITPPGALPSDRDPVLAQDQAMGLGEPSETLAPQESFAGGPPPVPVRDEGAESMQRRLSEAMPSNPASDPSVDGVWDSVGDEPDRAQFGNRGAHEAVEGGAEFADRAPVKLPATSGEGAPQNALDHSTPYRHHDDGSGPGRWVPSDDVTIEEGLPPIPRAVPGPSGHEPLRGSGNDEHNTSTQHLDQFQPSPPPANIRRSARRMPTVDDFPAVGQREYHAHTRGGSSQQQNPPQGHNERFVRGSQREGQNEQGVQKRPRSLFERLTGLGRRQSDSGKTREVSPQSAPHAVQQDPQRHHDGGGSDQLAHGAQDRATRETHPEESSEFPALFRRTRGG